MLLQADASEDGPDWTDGRIHEALHVSPSTIHRVRQRFVEQSLEAALSGRAMPPRPDKVKLGAGLEAHLIALACSDPPAGRARWTVRLLASVKTWCIPPKADAEFVCRMEDVLRVYQMPYDERHPVVCMDEASKQLIGESRVPVRPGKPRCEDYEYVRNGVCNQFVCCEPLRGWRKVT